MTFTSTSRAAAIHSARNVLASSPVFMDTETTGLSNHDEIIEIAILDTDGSPLVDQLVKPTIKIPSSATAINHITDDQVSGAQPLLFAWSSIRNILEKRTIAIYNADFDIRMIRQSLGNYNISWLGPMSQFCIMDCYARFFGAWDERRRSYRFVNLESAGRNCGILIPNSHRARDDAMLARELLHFIAKQT